MGDNTPEAVVRAYFAVWSRLDADAIMSWFAPDADWENVPIGVISGADAIRADVEEFLTRMKSYDAEFVNVAANGSIVFVERIDHVGIDDEIAEARVVAVFEVVDGKIKLWRDYFHIPSDDE